MLIVHRIKKYLKQVKPEESKSNMDAISIKKLERFFKIGDIENFYAIDNNKIVVNKEKISDWIDYANKIKLLERSNFDHNQLSKLEGAFFLCIIYLSACIICSLCLALLKVNFTVSIIFSGILGSSIAALISCLNRRANGFEDSNGNSIPKSNSNKEQFNIGMSYWFFIRPLLGIISIIVIWILDQHETTNQVLAIAFVAGLLSKTVIELFKEWPKKLLKI